MAQREIKFRGLRIDNGQWAYGYFFENNIGETFIVSNNNEDTQYGYQHLYDNLSNTQSFYRILPNTIGQFTGIKDIENEYIYEGDILSASYFGKLLIDFCTINGSIVGCKKNDFSDIDKIYNFYNDIVISDGWGIIGNIHQHPELIK